MVSIDERVGRVARDCVGWIITASIDATTKIVN